MKATIERGRETHAHARSCDHRERRPVRAWTAAAKGDDPGRGRQLSHGLRAALSRGGPGPQRPGRGLLDRPDAGHQSRVPKLRQGDRPRHGRRDRARPEGLSGRLAAHAARGLARLQPAQRPRRPRRLVAVVAVQVRRRLATALRPALFDRRPQRASGRPGGARRPRRPEILQPLRLGLDLRRRHAVQALEAGDLSGRRLRPLPGPLAQGHQGQGRDPAPVRARDRHGADRPRRARHPTARPDPRRHPVTH